MKPDFDAIIQRYLHGKTTRGEERLLLDHLLKGINKLMAEQRRIKKEAEKFQEHYGWAS